MQEVQLIEWAYTLINSFLTVAARLVDSIVTIGSTIVELLQATGMSREQADKMATIIQTAFRQYMAYKKAAMQTIPSNICIYTKYFINF